MNFQTSSKPDKVIASNEKYFKFFVIIPKIVTIILAAIFIVVGAFTNQFDRRIFPICLIVGAIVCVLVYIILKISLSYKVLHIYYLAKINSILEESAR